MTKFLIVYDTVQGQTRKIASVMEIKIHRLGHAVDVFNCRDLPTTLRLEDYAGVIVGAPVHAGGYPRLLRKWVKAHAATLSKMPSAFFSVCLGVLQKEEEVQRAEKDIVKRFLEKASWQPLRWTVFAGALSYSQYNWFLRHYMRWIARKAGADTDLTKDYEYTNWDDVRRFTREFTLEAVPPPAPSLAAFM